MSVSTNNKSFGDVLVKKKKHYLIIDEMLMVSQEMFHLSAEPKPEIQRHQKNLSVVVLVGDFHQFPRGYKTIISVLAL